MTFSPKGFSFRYDMREHDKLPHVVKFSGGRSSGALLLMLLENKILKPERGDVVVFNNTSAEHPATYEFVREFKSVAEEKHGVPFLWTEFQTYEDVVRGRWTRMPSYRLVRPLPFSAENPDGYHCKGEVFEELMSWKAYVPNLFRRVCTESMKLFVTREFLRDWLAAGASIGRLGHYGQNGSRVRGEDIMEVHKANGGKVPRHILLEKRAFLRGCPSFRPAQSFADFSSAAGKIRNPLLAGRALGGRVEVSGDNRVEYAALVGFRHDEPVRVSRMRARNNGAADEEGVHEKHRPEGEYVYAPLDDFKMRKEHIAAFWRGRKPHLPLPDDANLSNCVFCFLKGPTKIRDLVARQEKIDASLPPHLRSQPGTPSDIEWWARMEEKYGRNLADEKRKIKQVNGDGKPPENPIIGFFGMGQGGNYAFLRQKGMESRANPRRRPPPPDADESVSCDCTD